MVMNRRPSVPVLAGIGVAHLAITTLTWRDLQARPADGVRGGKRFWRFASAVNTSGSVAYWIVGRR